jgi:hypothetical protein
MRKCIKTDKAMKLRFLTIIAALMVLAPLEVDAQRGHIRPSHPHIGDRYTFFRGIGVTFGYVNSQYYTQDKATDDRISSDLMNGFTIGLTKDFALLPHALYFQTGLNYIYQNDSRNENIKIPLTDMSVRIVGDREEHHLGIPLRLKYDVHILDNIGLTFDAGPTLLMGLSSKYLYKTRLSEGMVTSVDYNLYNGKVKSNGNQSGDFNLEQWMDDKGMYPKGRLGRFDVMLGASVGAHFFHILEVRLGYDYGLLNRYRNDVADMYSMHRGQFTLSAGIRF